MKDLLEKLLLKRVIIWLVLFILFIFSALLKLSPDIMKSTSALFHVAPDGLKSVNDEVFTFLLPLILFNFIYQTFTEKENRKIAQQDITDAIHLNPNALKIFSNDTKRLFIKNIVCSIMGNRYGELFYNNMIKRYLDGKMAYREHFNYDVEINEASKDFTFKGVTVLQADKYYSLDQRLTYTKRFERGVNDLAFKIVFAFNVKSLDRLMNDEFIFFREVLQIDDWKNDINTYTLDDFRDFIDKCLKLRLQFFIGEERKIVGRDAYQINYINNDHTQGVEISINDKEFLKQVCFKNEGAVCYRCELAFVMPFNKSIKRFHFALPEPTIRPQFSMRFDRSFEEKNIDYFTHFSNTYQKEHVDKDHHGLKFSISASDIIYPRSGVVFFWD